MKLPIRVMSFHKEVERGLVYMTTLNQRIMQHLEQLCVAIGARPGGSHANHQAADYIRHIFNNAGLQVESQDFDCPDWACTETRLTTNGQTMEAAANTFSPACDVVAPVVTAGSLAELEAAELSGRIAVLYGELTKAPLAAKDWFLKDERDTHIVALLEQKAPAALLTVQAAGGDLPRIIEDAAFNIPSATVPARVGLALLCAQPPAVRLRIHSHRSNGHACNVVARTPLQGSARIVLCAHYDTKIDTPGAFDNGSGVAILLALAQTLGAHGRTNGLEFVAFTQEEYLPLGDDEYVRRAGEEGFARMLAAINIDGVGQAAGTNTITAMACSTAFQDHITALAQQVPGVSWTAPWPESNHSTFAWLGVPSSSFTTAGGANLVHQRHDTIDWISPAKLEEVAALVTAIVDSLQAKPLAWCRA